MKSGIAAAIKRLTAPEHQLAEKAVEAFGPFASRARYVAYLCKLHTFYSAVEPALFARLDLEPERRKLPLIERDLAALGAAAEPAGTASFRAPWRLPEVDILTKCPPLVKMSTKPDAGPRAFAAGIAYVLEGKTLGSRFLLEEARSRLGLDADAGASFLAGYGARTGAMWRAYLDALAELVAVHGRRARVLAGARATFRAFTGWISTS